MKSGKKEKNLSSNGDIRQIEELFLEKLQEKYSLTARDIKRAFGRFDKDGNGFLDVKELSGEYILNILDCFF